MFFSGKSKIWIYLNKRVAVNELYTNFHNGKKLYVMSYNHIEKRFFKNRIVKITRKRNYIYSLFLENRKIFSGSRIFAFVDKKDDNKRSGKFLELASVDFAKDKIYVIGFEYGKKTISKERVVDYFTDSVKYNTYYILLEQQPQTMITEGVIVRNYTLR